MPTRFDKTKLVSLISAQLQETLEAMSESAESARDAAINEESKSEDKHDTRSIEAGYLAGAQRKRVVELKELILFFKFLEPLNFSKKDPISATAVVEVESDEKTLYYFLVPKGGGISVTYDGKKIMTLNPQTPLGESLLTRHVGDSVALEVKGQFKEYDIISVS